MCASKYREFPSINNPDREFWALAAQNPSQIGKIYSIGLWDVVHERRFVIPEADPANRGSAAVYLRPQALDVTDIPATTITPTQDGGKFIESHGIIFKDIRIAGTVGLRPNPKNASFGAFNGSRGIPDSEATGFDDLIFLRNMFRGYADVKVNNELASHVIMVFYNYKDGETFIVEPVSFVVNREASNPLSYQYQIQLKTVGVQEVQLSLIDPIARIDLFDLIKEIQVELISGINMLTSEFENILNLPFSAITQMRSIPLSISNTFRSSLIRLLGSVTKITTLGQRMSAADQEYARQVQTDLKKIDFLAKQVVWHRSVYGVSPFGVPTTPEFREVIKEQNSSSLVFDLAGESAMSLAVHNDRIIKACSLCLRASKRFQFLDLFLDKAREVAVHDYAKAYDRGVFRSPISSTYLNPNNIVLPTGAREVIVGEDDTIRSLTRQYLGDMSKWKMLAILNNLKAPYISKIPASNVLVPGDKILIPQAAETTELSSVFRPASDRAVTSNNRLTLTQYGRDIKLASVSGDPNVFDLALTPSGDIALVEGRDNLLQAIFIKINTEKGTLPLHPKFGVGYDIGTKFDALKLQEHALSFRSAIYQDQRISRINSLTFKMEGDTIRAKAMLQATVSNEQIPYEFAIRRD